jgi:hypothetical protein
MAAPPVWSWDLGTRRRKGSPRLLGAIAYLKGHGLYDTDVIGAYNSRQVAPLMAHALPLYGMAPSVQLAGTALA